MYGIVVKIQQNTFMKNASDQNLTTTEKRFEHELKLFHNLSNGIFFNLEAILDLFDDFTPEQKGILLREIENARLNIHAISELLGGKYKKDVNKSD